MIGSHHILVANATCKYELNIKRNITILKGDSASGKTVLVDMIRDYVQNGPDSGITFSCDIPCRVIEGNTWEEQLTPIKGSIVFIDEGNRFVSSEAFAHYVREGKNYYVLVTREKLSNLPYSVSEIYGIRSTGKYNDLVPVYHETYHIYEEYLHNLAAGENISPNEIITEDSNSGYDFFRSIAQNSCNEMKCRTAGGKSNVYSAVQKSSDHPILIIADSAAFGPEMERICELIYSGAELHLFLPESFEWLILNSGIIKDISKDEIEHAENYADSEKYFSWERYFTNLLIQRTIHTPMAYTKEHLSDAYRSDNIIKRILATINGIDFNYESEN
ncbi:MAG: translation initiation factor 2 [Lachnospiraceae bacterium]|nr:translation initiation factor 2 [Lachnospiraceae bacterium]